MSTITKLVTNYYCNSNIRYVFLDGAVCNKLDVCYKTLQKQLSIPEYFGNNLDALDEVLADLEWVSEKKVRIIIANKAALLTDEPLKKQVFLDVLNNNENKNLEIIYLGEG